MRSTVFLLSLGLGSLLLPAQSPTDAIPGQIPYPALERRVGGTWLAHWNPATATPRVIVGTGIPLRDWRGNSLEEARRHALQALADHGDILGLPESSEFREAIGARMGRTWSFTFHQYHRGLPVIGGRADVRVHMTGAISMLGSTAFPVPADFDVVPTIDVEVATARAWAARGEEPTGVPQPGKPAAPRLVIFGDVHAATVAPFALAWEIPISNLDQDGNGSIGRCYVDAAKGHVLHWISDKHECGFAACRHSHHGELRSLLHAPAAVPPAPVPTTVTVQAWTRTSISSTYTLANIPVEGLVVTVPGIGTRTTDANGQFTIDIGAAVTITIGALDGTRCQPIQGNNAPNVVTQVQPGVNATIQLLSAGATQEQSAHTTTLYWVQEVNEWTRTILGNSSQLATLDNVRPTVNIASTCNAFYTNNTINFYATGGSCNNTAISTVIAHEWGHGLDAMYGGISNSSGDGLSEAWGDIVGMYLVGNPTIGAGFSTNGSGIRTGNNTRQFTSLTSTTGVHASGEVFMGMAWKLRQNLLTALGSINGTQVANDIVLGSIVADATNQQDAVRQIQLADDDDSNLLNGTPHYTQIRAACLAHSLPFQEVVLGTLAHTGLPNTTVAITPRKVFVAAIPNTGSFTSVTLHSTINGASAQRTMIPSGVANQFQAMLPGVPTGTSVSYHFEAAHSTGPVIRHPAAGSFTYTVGNDITVFTEDFETNGPGWTHGLVATQDDWQVGDPAGRTGTGWADPQVAARGLRCYGNDLGNTIGTQAWNGAYQNNVNNWLRSPVINCSGRSGVRLRFQRWLTVQAGQFDQATISVNGQQVWVNPFSTNLVDTSWQSVEIPIPMADNNPSVQLEWRLVTNGSVVFGGWNIDDVEVVATGTVTPPPAELRMLPEQIAGGMPVTLAITTPGPAPFVLVIGDTAGPTSIPGVPTLEVGGGIFSLSGFSGPGGAFLLPFTAPAGLPATGLTWFSQVLTLDAGLNLVVSNQHVNLFTP